MNARRGFRLVCRLGAPAAWLAAATPLAAQVAGQATGVVAMAERRVDAGNGVEQSSGMLVGGEGRLVVGSRFELFVHAAGGKLNADSASADDADFGEVLARASVVTVPWLALDAGVSSRAFATSLVRQRWTALRLGGELRLAFVGGVVTGVLRGEILPSVTVSGLAKPSRAYAAGAGLDYRIGVFALGLRYEFERYDFPVAAGFARRDQLSTLIANAGIALGRIPAP